MLDTPFSGCLNDTIPEWQSTFPMKEKVESENNISQYIISISTYQFHWY